MLYAQFQNEKIAATPWLNRDDVFCPKCHSPVLSKCGDIRVWHWAHVARPDCDPWKEGETRWHIDWKSLFPAKWVEIPMGNHRADVRLPNGQAIEFQNSAISPEEIETRERFYGRMIWVFNAADWHVDLRLKEGASSRLRTFRFRWPHVSLSAVQSPMFWDLGEDLLLFVKKAHWELPTGGWGILYTKDGFVKRCLSHCRRAKFPPMPQSGGYRSYRSTAASPEF